MHANLCVLLTKNAVFTILLISMTKIIISLVSSVLVLNPGISVGEVMTPEWRCS